MAAPLALAMSLVQGLISRVQHAKVNNEQCRLLGSMAEHARTILQKVEEREFDSSVTTALELVVGALTEADEVVEKCCRTNWLYAALYHEDHSLELKQAAEKLEHALSQIPLASLGMTADIQSDLVELKTQIRNTKFEERARVAHNVQGVRDALDQAFNQTGEGTYEVKDLIRELVQEHSSSGVELIDELVTFKRFAFEAKQNKEKRHEFELNQIISVLSESLGDIGEVPRVAHDLEDCHRCPLSKEIMKDPVVLKDSCMIYDRSSITDYLRRGHRYDPLTNTELVSGELVSNHVLRDACQLILQQYGAQSPAIPRRKEEKKLKQSIEPGLYEGKGKFVVDSNIVHTSQLLVLGHNGKVVGCTLYTRGILGAQENSLDIGAGEWNGNTYKFSFGDCQFNYNGKLKLKTDVHKRGIKWTGRVSKDDALEEDYKFSLTYYPPSVRHAVPAHPTILEMENKLLTIREDTMCHSKAVLSLERDSSVDGWISFESACLESKKIGYISGGSWNENGSLTFSIFFPPNDTPLNSDSRPTNYEACFEVSGTLTHGQKLSSPSFSGTFMKTQEQGAARNVKAIPSPLDSLERVEYPVIREASTPWHYVLQNPLKIFQLSKSFELERSQYAIREKFDARYGLILHSQRAFGMSPLHVASANNSIEFVEELIDEGADINLRDNNGQSPLHHASLTNSIDAVKLLISNDIEIDLQDKFGKSPLHVALTKNSALVVEELIDNDANINLQDNDGSTPLHHATFNNSIDAIKSLISNGANIDLQDNYGQTPLYIASEKNMVDVIKELILNRANVNLQRKDGSSPLYIASAMNASDVAKELLEKGANVNFQMKNGFSPLHIASLSNHVDVIKELVSHNATINVQDTYGMTPLHIASSWGQVSTVHILLEHGASKETKNTMGHTPYDIMCVMELFGTSNEAIEELDNLLRT